MREAWCEFFRERARAVRFFTEECHHQRGGRVPAVGPGLRGRLRAVESRSQDGGS